MKITKRHPLIALLSIAVITLLGFTTSSAGITAKIPYPPSYDAAGSGASSYQNRGDHKNSPYFVHPDFYNMKSNGSLTLISGFKTYQQVTEWSCGPSAALMVLYHYGNTQWDELKLGKAMHCEKNAGTSTEEITGFFTDLGWSVKSSLTESTYKDGDFLAHPEKFKTWVIRNLKENSPIMVEWIDWGGHWQDIVGYDTMGTDSIGDDVLIAADPYDTSDHWQDGYYIIPAERFLYMWFDAHILPEGQKKQQWVIARPRKL